LTRYKGSKPNACEIDLYNLSDVSMARFTQSGLSVVVYAGLDTPGEIFRGELDRRGTKTRQSGGTWTTTITAADKRRLIRDSTYSGSWPANTRRSAILPDVVRALGVPVGFQGVFPDRVYAAGWTFTGYAKDALTSLLEQDDIVWQVQAGVLDILGPTDNLPESVPLVTPKTGLHGSPSGTDKGVQFSAEYNARFKPGASVQLDSLLYSGTYTITQIQDLVSCGQLANWESRVQATIQ
jgi:hypothetical protein